MTASGGKEADPGANYKAYRKQLSDAFEKNETEKEKIAPQLDVKTNLDDCKVKLQWSFNASDRDVYIDSKSAKRNWTTWGTRLARCIDSVGYLMDMVATEIDNTLTTPNDYLEVLHGMMCDCPDGALEIFHWPDTSMWQPRKTSSGGYTWPPTFFGGTFHEFCLNVRKCLKRDNIPSRSLHCQYFFETGLLFF